ncbi:MAG: hypothetical protein HY810_08705 [Candidatus Omnitrophica bacterium]|nr:hypothetical protein [Candidatus Omnitrophota bacterium]
MRGLKGMTLHGIFFFFNFFLYFFYCSIVEDLIRRFKITNLQLILVAFCFGINIGSMLFINVVWWGSLQSVLTFYFANRFCKRDWSEKPMGPLGWILSVGYIVWLAVFMLFKSKIPLKGTAHGYFMSVIIFLVALIYLIYSINKNKREPWDFKQSFLLDCLSFFSVCVFMFLGTFVAVRQVLVSGSLGSPLAIKLSAAWTLVVFMGMLLYYLKNKKQISI